MFNDMQKQFDKEKDLTAILECEVSEDVEDRLSKIYEYLLSGII